MEEFLAGKVSCMSSNPLAILSDLFDRMSASDNAVREPAEHQYFEMEKANPDEVMQMLISAASTDNVSLRQRALIRIKVFMSLHMNYDEILSQPTIQGMMESLQQAVINTSLTPLEKTYTFLIIEQMIPRIVSKGFWPNIFGIMLECVRNLQNSAQALRFFASYVSATHDQRIPDDLMGAICGLVSLDYQNPEDRAAVLSLIYSLCSRVPQVMDLFKIIPNAFLALPDERNIADNAISDFSLWYKNNFAMVASACEGITIAFMQLAADAERSMATRISALEALVNMETRSPPIHRALVSNMDSVMQMLGICFSNPYDPDDESEISAVYNAALEFLETFLEKVPDGQKIFNEAFIGNLGSFTPHIIGAVISVNPIPQLFEQIVQFLGADDKVLVSNAVEGMSTLFRKEKFMRKLLRNEEAVSNVASTMIDLAQKGKPQVLGALASLAEGIQDAGKLQLLERLAPTLLAIAQQVPTADAMRCAAAVGRGFPAAISSQALALATKAMQIVTAGTDAESEYALMIAVSVFASSMPPQELVEFVTQLMELAKSHPEICMWKGTRLIARNIGEQFGSFMPLLMPFLLEKTLQRVEITVADTDEYRGGDDASVLVPGTNKVMKFKNEQFAEMCSAAESLADYAQALSASFEPFYADTVKGAAALTAVVFDEEVRMSGVTLFEGLAMAIPAHSGEIVDHLIKLYADEPLSQVQQAIMGALEKILELEQCPEAAKIQFVTVLPEIVQRALTDIRQSVTDDTFEGEEEDNYLNLLWSGASALKPLYAQIPAAAVESAKKVIEMLPQSLLGEEIDLIAQFTAAIWVDCLSFGPVEVLAQAQPLLAQLAEGAKSFKNADLRRLCLYGFGRILTRQPLDVAFADAILNLLYTAVKVDEAKDEQFWEGNACAASSYGLILLKRLEGDGSAEQIGHFLEMFPPQSELEEVAIAYECLCSVLNMLRPETEQFRAPVFAVISGGLSDEDIAETVLQKVTEFISAGSPAAAQLQQVLQGQ